MSNIPETPKAADAKAGKPKNVRSQADQRAERARRDALTRSTLSRLRNRKSDLK